MDTTTDWTQWTPPYDPRLADAASVAEDEHRRLIETADCGQRCPGCGICCAGYRDLITADYAGEVTCEREAGLKISVLQLGGVEAGGSVTRERGHTVRITLSPILSREEQRRLLEEDGRMWDGVRRATQAALRKAGVALAGEPE